VLLLPCLEGLSQNTIGDLRHAGHRGGRQGLGDHHHQGPGRGIYDRHTADRHHLDAPEADRVWEAAAVNRVFLNPLRP
jgi:hypothetical protein